MAQGSVTALLQAIIANTQATTQAINNLKQAFTGGNPPNANASQIGGMQHLVGLMQQLVQNTTQKTKTVTEERLTKFDTRLQKAGAAFSGVVDAGLGIAGAAAKAATTNQMPTGMVGDVLDKVAEYAKLIPGAGQLVSAFTTLTAAVWKMPDALQRFGRELLNSNLQLAEFSGAMQAVKAYDFINQMQIAIRKGELQAPSAMALAESQNRLEQNTAGIEGVGKSIFNAATSKLLNKVSDMLENSNVIKGLITMFMLPAYTQSGASDMGPPVAAWQRGELESLAGSWGPIYGLPNRFNNGSRPPRFIPPNVAGP